MKAKFISQSILSFFVLALGLYALYEYRKAGEELKEELLESSLVSQNLKNLRAFKIIKEDQTVIELAEEAGDWRTLEPVSDLADWSEVSRWFDEIKNIEVQKVKLEEGEVFQPKDYYLDKAVSLEMKFAEEEEGKLLLSISQKSSFDGKYFVQKGGELFIAEPYIYYETNNKDFESFRSKRLLPSMIGHPGKIQFKGQAKRQAKGQGPWTIHWSDHRWSLDPSVAGKPEVGAGDRLPLDHRRLDEFWNDLSAMKASALKEKISPSILKKYALNRPQKTLLFYWPQQEEKEGEKEGKEPSPLSLSLSPFKDGRAFVSVSNRDFVLELDQTQAEKLLLKPLDIYDHHFPFRFKTAEMGQIQFMTASSHFVIEKTAKGWKRLTTEERLEPKPSASSKETQLKHAASTNIEFIEQQKLEKFLEKLQDLKGLKYKKASSQERAEFKIKGEKREKTGDQTRDQTRDQTGGLRSIRIKTAQGKELFTLEEISISQNENKSQKSNKGSNRRSDKGSGKKSWVKTNQWAELIQLDSKALDEIFSMTFKN